MSLQLSGNGGSIEKDGGYKRFRARERERERDVGIICVIIDDDLALKAWTQRRERERKVLSITAPHTYIVE